MPIANYITVNTALDVTEEGALRNRRRLDDREEQLVSLGRSGWSLCSTVAVVGQCESWIIDTLFRADE